MKKLLTGTVIAVVLASGALYAFGGPGFGGPGCGGFSKERSGGFGPGMKGRFGSGVMSELDLTSEQRKEMREIMFNHRESMIEKEITTPFAGALDANGNFDKKTFMENAEKNQKSMLEERAAMFEKMLAVLTPAQKQTLAAKLAQ